MLLLEQFFPVSKCHNLLPFTRFQNSFINVRIKIKIKLFCEAKKYEGTLQTQNFSGKSIIGFVENVMYNGLDFCSSTAFNLGKLVENNM